MWKSRIRPRLTVLIALAPLAASVALPADGSAQERPEDPFHASPYLSLGSWEYPILDYWVATGRINSLSPIVKPWRRIEIARALADLDQSELGRGEREWLARLRVAYAGELSRLKGRRPGDVSLAIELAGGAQYASQTHRDVLRPELEGRFAKDRVLEDARAGIDGTAGPVAGAFRIRRHGIYRHDPQFAEGRVVPKLDNALLGELSSRVEEAWVEVQSRYVRIGFGNMYRNWGLPDLPGFLRSDYAYSEEEVSYRFGTDRVFLIGMFASYGDHQADTTHFVAIHRLEVRPVDDLVIGVSESSIHGGPGQKLDFKLINPVSIWQIGRTDGDPPYNKIGQVDLWWRTGAGLNLYGSLLADATNENESCCQIGGSLGLEVPRAAPGFLLRGNFTFIQSLTYTPNNIDVNRVWERYTVERLGIGWDKADLYLVSVQAEWFPRAALWLRPKLDLQVLGEFDIRDDRPSLEELPDWPRILVGQRETTVRPALEGRWRSGGPLALELEWDVGVSFIRDQGHVAGNDRTEFVGTVGLRLRTPRWQFGVR